MKLLTNQLLSIKYPTYLKTLCNTIHIMFSENILKAILLLALSKDYFSEVGIAAKQSFQVFLFLIILNPTLKFFLVLNAFHIFFIDTGIDWKKFFQTVAFVVFMAISAVVLFKLLTRALDISVNAQQAVSTVYQSPEQQNLKK